MSTVHHLPDLRRARAFIALFDRADDEAASALLSSREGVAWITAGMPGPQRHRMRACRLLLREPAVCAMFDTLMPGGVQ